MMCEIWNILCISSFFYNSKNDGLKSLDFMQILSFCTTPDLYTVGPRHIGILTAIVMYYMVILDLILNLDLLFTIRMRKGGPLVLEC